jgi:hypothetical protein
VKADLLLASWLVGCCLAACCTARLGPSASCSPPVCRSRCCFLAACPAVRGWLPAATVRCITSMHSLINRGMQRLAHLYTRQLNSTDLSTTSYQTVPMHSLFPSSLPRISCRRPPAGRPSGQQTPITRNRQHHQQEKPPCRQARSCTTQHNTAPSPPQPIHQCLTCSLSHP